MGKMIPFEPKRVVARQADIDDGEEFTFFRNRALFVATAVHCDECQALGTVNEMLAQPAFHRVDKLQALKFFQGEITADIGANNRTGGASCTDCYSEGEE